jgi:hypothetical protein
VIQNTARHGINRERLSPGKAFEGCQCLRGLGGSIQAEMQSRLFDRGWSLCHRLAVWLNRAISF